MCKENCNATDGACGLCKKRCCPSALDGPLHKKKMRHTDPLVHSGRHFGRTIHAMCNVYVLLTQGVQQLVDEADAEYESTPDEDLSVEQRKERKVFRELLHAVPGLEKRLMNSSEEELEMIATSIQRGASSARSDDTKSLKSAVIDWLAPPGVPVNPPLSRNVKTDRGFYHELTGALLCPANLDWEDKEIKTQLRNADYIVSGDEWPIFLYENYHFDPLNPWNGLLRSRILVKAYKHVFTSPSSADRELKATKSGNARLHGMKRVTLASLAYVATILRFSLSSATFFTKSDIITDSQRFYTSILDFLSDPDEIQEVHDLQVFWNRQIFPEYVARKGGPPKNTALARLKEKRAILKAKCTNTPKPPEQSDTKKT